MDTSGQEEVTDHGHNQDHQAEIDQNTVLSGVDHLLGGQLGGQHSRHQADVEVGEEGRQSLFLSQNGGIGNDRAVRDHQKHHVEHEGEGRPIDGIPDGKLLPFHLGVMNPAAGYADQSGYRNGKNREERGLATHVFLHLKTHIGSQRHADGYGKGKPADALCDFRPGQNVAGQRHSGGPADRIDGAHVQSDDDQCAKDGKGDKGREGQAEQRQKQQIDPIAVEVIQEITSHRAEQNGGNGHSRQYDSDFRASDADLLTINRDDGNGCVESC